MLPKPLFPHFIESSCSNVTYSLPLTFPDWPIIGQTIHLGFLEVAPKPWGEHPVSSYIFSWSEHEASILKTQFKMGLLPSHRFSLPGMVKLHWSFMASSVTMEIDGFFSAIPIRGPGVHKQKRWELTWTLFVQLASNESILKIDRLQPH